MLHVIHNGLLMTRIIPKLMQNRTAPLSTRATPTVVVEGLLLVRISAVQGNENAHPAHIQLQQ